MIQPMGSLHPQISLPSLLPKSLSMTVIAFKDCFSKANFHKHDREGSAFLVPTYNNGYPIKRHHWKVLPQGISNRSYLV